MFDRLRIRFAKWRTYRSTVRRLSDLDRHILADIGIKRDAIRTCALDAVEGRCD